MPLCNVLLAALIAQAAGPIGPEIDVAPDVDFTERSIAYSPEKDMYVTGYTVMPRNVHLGYMSAETVVAMIHPATGLVSAPRHLENPPNRFTTQVALAWNAGAKRFLAVFAAHQGSYDDPAHFSEVYGIILDENAVPFEGSAPFRISTPHVGPSSVDWIRVASDGKDWRLAWQFTLIRETQEFSVQSRGVRGSSTNTAPELDESVSVTESLGKWTDGRTSNVLIAFGSTDYLIVWGERTPHRILGRTISSNGTLGGIQRYDNLNLIETYLTANTLISNEATGGFLLGWTEDRAIPWNPITTGDSFILKIAPDGNPGGELARVFVDGCYPGSLTFAWNRASRQYLATWVKITGGASELWTAGLDDTDLEFTSGPVLLAPLSTYWVGYERFIQATSRGARNEAIIQWAVSPDTQTHALKAQSYNLGPNTNSPYLANLAQVGLDGGTPLPPGGTTLLPGFIPGAVVGCRQAVTLRLEVEVQEAGVAFSGIPTATSAFVPPGRPVSLPIPLSRGHSYHWQARAIDATNRMGEWISFGPDVDFVIRSNSPAMPVSPGQFDPIRGMIPVGKTADLRSVTFRSGLSDADGDATRLEIEVRPVGEGFNGQPTAVSAFSPPGAVVEMSIEFPEGAYHWRLRATDAALESSAWSSFGGNDEADADFVLLALGSTSGASCQAGGGTAAGWMFVTALIAAIAFNASGKLRVR